MPHPQCAPMAIAPFQTPPQPTEWKLYCTRAVKKKACVGLSDDRGLTLINTAKAGWHDPHGKSTLRSFDNPHKKDCIRAASKAYKMDTDSADLQHITATD